jgi:hypothetical protein
VFNVSTSTLAVQVWTERGDGFEAGEIYIRPHDAGTYRRIAAPGESTISDESLISSNDGPYLFFIRKVGAKDDVGWELNVRAIVRLDLRTGEPEECMRGLVGAERWWPAELLSACAEGRFIHARVGSVAPGQVRASYGVSRIDLADETSTPLINLPAMFV